MKLKVIIEDIFDNSMVRGGRFGLWMSQPETPYKAYSQEKSFIFYFWVLLIHDLINKLRSEGMQAHAFSGQTQSRK